jgi:hypothetical protein
MNIATPPGLRRATQTSTAIAARILELELELAQLQQQQRDETDARFLRAIAVSIRGACFSTADLVEHATIDADLREALRGLRPKQLGKRLARLVDRDVQGLIVRRVLLTKTGWVWVLHFNHGAGLGD